MVNARDLTQRHWHIQDLLVKYFDAISIQSSGVSSIGAQTVGALNSLFHHVRIFLKFRPIQLTVSFTNGRVEVKSSIAKITNFWIPILDEYLCTASPSALALRTSQNLQLMFGSRLVALNSKIGTKIAHPVHLCLQLLASDHKAKVVTYSFVLPKGMIPQYISTRNRNHPQDWRENRKIEREQRIKHRGFPFPQLSPTYISTLSLQIVCLMFTIERRSVR